MNIYKTLLDQITPCLNSTFSELSAELQERISQVGLGELIKEIHDGSIEEFDYAIIEKENRILEGVDAKKAKGKGIKKGKGIRGKVTYKHSYKWDDLSMLQREYFAAKYDFHNHPDLKENAAKELLTNLMESHHLECRFSDLPQQIKMRIAFVDIFQVWNEISAEQRAYLANEFDARMQPNFEKEVNKFCDMYLELTAISDEMKKLENRKDKLTKQFGCSDFDIKQKTPGLQNKILAQKTAIQRTNQNRAFLLDCFNNGIEKNIESVWLHIVKNAGKDGFLFATASKETATTMFNVRIDKDKLNRCLLNLPYLVIGEK